MSPHLVRARIIRARTVGGPAGLFVSWQPLYPSNQWGPDAFFRSTDGDVRLPGPTGDPSARLGGTENRPIWMILLFAVLGLTAVGLSVMSYVKRHRLARRVELVRQRLVTLFVATPLPVIAMLGA